jgi:hypothetical protein
MYMQIAKSALPVILVLDPLAQLQTGCARTVCEAVAG